MITGFYHHHLLTSALTYKKSPNDLQLDIWALVRVLAISKKDLERELIGCNHLK